MVELSLNGIVKYFGSNEVLSNITFQVNNRDRLGLVGRNGSGKSTILKLISGEENIDGGSIDISRGSTVGYLQQIPTYEKSSLVKDVLHSAFKNIYILEKDMKVLEDKMRDQNGELLDKLLRQYSYIQGMYEAVGGYNMEEKLSKVCMGLKFNEEFIKKPFEVLSGGEKTRVILGKILLENPDILLLDEPTNHLDMESLEWLEEYLKSYKGTVIVVSHDRYFLDNVTTKTVEVEDKECTIYKGNYSYYIKQKEENMMLQFEAFKEQEKKIKAMENTIKQLMDWGNRADNVKFIKRAQSMQKRLDKVERVDKPKLEKENIKLTFIEGERSGVDVIKVESAYKRFKDKTLINNGSFLVRFKEKIALIGPNGSGKSTFIKILLGEEKVDHGKIEVGANVRIGYLPQDITFNDETMTVIECFRDNIEILEGKAREYLAKFMFFGENVFKKVENLSGGEKTRLKLSKLIYEDVNLLILDEPTNHLDIDSIEILESALEEFKGTIFFVSHDRYFINKISNRIISIEGNEFINYLGDYDYYRLKYDERNKEKTLPKVIKEVNVRREKQVDPSKKKEKLRKNLEDEMIKLENEIQEITNKMNELADNYEELNKYYEKKIHIEEKLEKVIEDLMEYL